MTLDFLRGLELVLGSPEVLLDKAQADSTDSEEEDEEPNNKEYFPNMLTVQNLDEPCRLNKEYLYRQKAKQLAAGQQEAT